MPARMTKRTPASRISLNRSVTSRDDLGEVLRIGGDAADDPPGGELIVEGKIVAGGGGKGLAPQVEHHVGHGPAGQPAPDPVRPPDDEP